MTKSCGYMNGVKNFRFFFINLNLNKINDTISFKLHVLIQLFFYIVYNNE